MNSPTEKDDEASSTCVEDEEEEMLIPSNYICPLTLGLMKDPLVSRHGQSYEREAIMQWLGAGNTTCPMTRKPLRLSDLITNHALRSQIQNWQRENNYTSRTTNSKSSTDSSDQTIETEKVLGMYFSYETTDRSQDDPPIILEWRRPTDDEDNTDDSDNGRDQPPTSRRRNRTSAASQTTATSNSEHQPKRTGIFSLFRSRRGLTT
jgi:U-box domain